MTGREKHIIAIFIAAVLAIILLYSYWTLPSTQLFLGSKLNSDTILISSFNKIVGVKADSKGLRLLRVDYSGISRKRRLKAVENLISNACDNGMEVVLGHVEQVYFLEDKNLNRRDWPQVLSTISHRFWMESRGFRDRKKAFESYMRIVQGEKNERFKGEASLLLKFMEVYNWEEYIAGGVWGIRSGIFEGSELLRKQMADEKMINPIAIEAIIKQVESYEKHVSTEQVVIQSDAIGSIIMQVGSSAEYIPSDQVASISKLCGEFLKDVPTYNACLSRLDSLEKIEKNLNTLKHKAKLTTKENEVFWIQAYVASESEYSYKGTPYGIYTVLVNGEYGFLEVSTKVYWPPCWTEMYVTKREDTFVGKGQRPRKGYIYREAPAELLEEIESAKQMLALDNSDIQKQVNFERKKVVSKIETLEGILGDLCQKIDAITSAMVP